MTQRCNHRNRTQIAVDSYCDVETKHFSFAAMQIYQFNCLNDNLPKHNNPLEKRMGKNTTYTPSLKSDHMKHENKTLPLLKEIDKLRRFKPNL